MKIHIVTPSFNQCAYLQQTMQSVLEQSGDFDLTWQVVDGGSTDGTVELLQSIKDPRVRWTSQSDRGQAHALNKGLVATNADVVGWLNSDDLYTSGALAAVATAFRTTQADWLVGRCQIVDDHGSIIRSPIARYKDRFLNRYSYRKLLRENFIAQPAVFWRGDFGLTVGPLDELLHYTMDYDLWLRMGKRADPVILDQVLAQFRIHGSSKSGQVNREQFDEGYRVASRYFDGDKASQIAHRMNVEKIVWAYRVLRWLGR